MRVIIVALGLVARAPAVRSKLNPGSLNRSRKVSLPLEELLLAQKARLVLAEVIYTALVKELPLSY